MSSQPVRFQHIKLLLLDSVLEKKSLVVRILASLALLSFAQGLFILLTGPLFKSMLGAVQATEVAVIDLAPKQLAPYLNFLDGMTIPQAQVIKLVPGALLVVGILLALAGYSYQYSQQALTLYVGSRFREKLFAAVLKQPLEKLLQKAPGEWMSLIMNDVAYLQSRLSDLLVGLVKDSVVVFSALVWLYFIHWPTALLLTLLSIPLMFGTGRTGKKISHYAEGWQRNLAKMASSLLEMRKRFEFIRAQGGEKAEYERFQQLNQAYYSNIVRSIFIRSAFAPGLEFLGFAMLAAVIFFLNRGWIGQSLVQSGELLQFLMTLGVIIRPLKSIGEQVSRLQETGGIIRRSAQTFSNVDQFQTQTSEPILEPISGITIDKLLVRYGEGFQLKAEGLSVKAGERVAIIGPSGGGKSTLLKCLAGLYSPDVWEGTPPWSVVKDNASLVSQKPFLFSGSIAENLNYGLKVAREGSETQSVLSYVGLDREFKDKGQSLDSALDFLQGSLSGGQMQRLTIARGLLRPHSLILMDEVTSAIDPAAEESITQKVLQRSKEEGRILLYVTHRLSQLTLFDQVWFCERGAVTVFANLKEWQNNERIQRFIEAETNH
ncbi:MAG: ABC transporter ATP-binding protein [Proteobacteria bacterium]|nr:MAG: ABC transporter ATP-binding protein [Pseudomonadota bacterium]